MKELKNLQQIKSEEIELVKTCNGRPEQYKAFIKNKAGVKVQIGYIRLRWGEFKVYIMQDKWDINDWILISKTSYGKEYTGDFSNKEDELRLLNYAKENIAFTFNRVLLIIKELI